MLTDGRTDGRTEWGIAIALSQIGWLGAKIAYEKRKRHKYEPNCDAMFCVETL